MKFGSRLAEQRKAEWAYYYINYDLCKRFLKNTTFNIGEVDEAAFVEILERELEKVASFRKMKGDELNRRVAKCERAFAELVKTYPSISELVSSPVLGASVEETLLVRLREDVNRLLAETADLNKYTRLNYSGFMKILKKHDRYTTFQLKPTFLLRMRERPFYEESVDPLVIRLSRIFQNVRTGGKAGTGTDTRDNIPDKFVRKTTKYWVHYDKVDDLRNQILRKIPILIVKDKKGTVVDDLVPNSAVSTVYLDNDHLDLYNERVERKAGSQLIRLRWYGDMDAQEVFVERKVLKVKKHLAHSDDGEEDEDEDDEMTHHNGKPVAPVDRNLADEETEKSRFTVKESKVNEYLNGKHKMDRSIQKQNEKLVLESVQSPTFSPMMASSAPGVRTPVALGALQSPSLVATTTRTAVPSSSRLESLARLSTEIAGTIQARHLRPVLRTFYNRTAFQVPGDLRVRISLDTELTFIREDSFDGVQRAGDNWRRPDALATWPFDYLPADDVEAFPYAILEVKIQMVEGGAEPDWVQKLVRDPLIKEVPTFSKYIHGAAQLLENKVVMVPQWMSLIEKEFGSTIGTKRIQPSDVMEAAAMASPSMRGVDPQLESRRPVEVAEPVPLGTPAVVGFQAIDVTKRIVIPVRIEPKVYFANERTFLTWLHFVIVICSVALGLLNFGDKVGQIAGVMFTLVGFMFMAHAAFLHMWRADMINVRGSKPFDDLWGPTVLSIVLVIAVAVNLYLKFVDEDALF
ncbi:VTC domain-containing protein [Chytriomyces sp. MP71]|nr:VTC domain-containing protein [Chytriomyces sp. MP71]